jgi:hypothetical protein
MTRNRVLLPHPLGPSRTRNSPPGMSRLTSSRATVVRTLAAPGRDRPESLGAGIWFHPHGTKVRGAPERSCAFGWTPGVVIVNSGQRRGRLPLRRRWRLSAT